MTKRNRFIAALESELSGTVGPEDVTNQSTLQPKPGTGKDDAELSLDEIKTKKEFGEDAEIAGHDDIDTVAESQEHTLALEQLQATAMRFCRMGAALEEIAEAAQCNLEAGNPMDVNAVQLVTTAVDAAGLGEPLKDGIALESFGFSPQVATEGFIDAIKGRAEKIWQAVGKFLKKAWSMTREKFKRAADYFRALHNSYEKAEKDFEVLNGHAGKPFQTTRWEKSLQRDIYAPASTKSPVAAVDSARAELDEVMSLTDGKLHAAVRDMNAAWSTDKPETVVAAMNRVLVIARTLTEMGSSRFKHSSCSIEVNLPERVTVDSTGALEGTRVVWEDGLQQFTAGVKIATIAEAKKLKEDALRAERAFDSMWDSFWFEDFEPQWKTRSHFEKDQADIARKLLVKYVNLLRVVSDLTAGCVWGSGYGYYRNSFMALRWVRFSIAEAKKAAIAAK